MDRIEISLLGPVHVAVDGRPVTDFRTESARALLAYLAMHGDAPCRRDALAALLWPDRPDAAALRNLRVALNRLRTALHDREANPPFLLITHRTVQLNPQADHWLDVTAFGERVAAVEQHGHDRLETCSACIRSLQEAVELYGGEFLSGLYVSSRLYEEWVVVQRETLHRQALDALSHLAEIYEGRAEYDLTLDYARRQVELEPWREVAHRQWMRALALSGQRSAALAQYGTCREILIEELGVEPEEETVALYERIRDGVELRPISPLPPHNLPSPLTPFVGREALLAEIREQLQDPACRLLTLVGPGGSGKTRLALEVAKGLLSDGSSARYRDGVFFISLAPLRSARTIVPTMARALAFGFYGEGEPKEQLLSYLRRKAMLLVLDNFEHLLEGAGLVTEVLRTAPEVKILATSRAALNVEGEYRLHIEGMEYPEPETQEGALEYSAVKLFLQSAVRAHPGVEWTADELVSVAQICRQVGGMPLGIVLAAAWSEMLSPAEIAAEIARSLDFLQSDLHDLPDRQRSMRAVFDHSWSLLTERERRALRELSVFRGGFTREEVGRVTGASLRDLMALVNRSLLHRTPRQRYELHELVRQYAGEQLCLASTVGKAERGEPGGVEPKRECMNIPGRYCVAVGERHCAAVHDRHCAYYVAALQQWERDLKGARQRVALAEMDIEIENARAAWDWAVEQGHVEEMGRAMEGLALFYDRRTRYQEGEAAFQEASERLDVIVCQSSDDALRAGSGAPVRVLARALAWQGVFDELSGYPERSSQLLQRGRTLLERLELAGQDIRLEKAFILWAMGESEDLITRMSQAARERARGQVERSLALYRNLGDRWWTANVLHALAHLARASEDYEQAKPWFAESADLFRALGDAWGTARSTWRLGFIHAYQGRAEEAERLGRDSYAIYQELGGSFDIGLGSITLAVILGWRGKYEEACALAEKGLAAWRDLGLRRQLATWSPVLAQQRLHLGLYDEAYAHAQETLSLGREFGDKRGIGLSLRVLGRLALAKGAHIEAQQMLEQDLAVCRELGRRDGLGEALAAAGCAARAMGELGRAARYLCEALRTALEIRAQYHLMDALPAIALVFSHRGKTERAVELYSLASRYPVVANSHWFEDIVGKHTAAAARTLPSEIAAAAQERGRARDLWATAEELLAELETG